MTEVLQTALTNAVEQTRTNIPAFAQHYPDDCTVRGRYAPRAPRGSFPAGANQGWTTGFVPGCQWLAYEVTGDDEFRVAASAHAADFARRVHDGEDLDTHDLGFLYTLACVAPWRLLGAEADRDAALAAADALMLRFLEPAGIIQAWGALTDPEQRGRTIIDSLMNLPLLTWATDVTGEVRYAAAAARHARRLAAHIVRPDGTTFHTYTWDAVTGEPVCGTTAQGAADDSCWARGQAWGIYGFSLAFDATGDPALLAAARSCAEYFLARLPADGVVFWDLVFSDGDDEPRDASAASIAACGLHELSRHETDPARAARYAAAGQRMTQDAVAYSPAAQGVDSDALQLHSVYSRPAGEGVDEGCLWGDYFYLEALVRHTRPDWRRYW